MTAAQPDAVSLVLLTYNCAHRVRPIVERALALDVPVVAVDNASTDGTQDVLAEYPRLDVVALARNIGAAARNIGVRRTRTRYVAFCDDDGWYEPDGLLAAARMLDRHPTLALVGARILVGEQQTLDPICVVMQGSPLPDRVGIPGPVLLGFMAGAVVVRVAAFGAVGGYRQRYFIGAEEETLALPLARAGWHMRYCPELVMHHEPSIANAPYLRAFGLRNTLWTCWLHRRFGSAVRYTANVLADAPKNADWLRGVSMALRGLPWVRRERVPMPRRLDAELRLLDDQRFTDRRSFFTRSDPLRAYR